MMDFIRILAIGVMSGLVGQYGGPFMKWAMVGIWTMALLIKLENIAKE